jgi:hypothetical protein
MQYPGLGSEKTTVMMALAQKRKVGLKAGLLETTRK